MKVSILISGILAMAACTFAAESSGSGSAGVVVVEVNGKKLTLGELEQKHPLALFQARNNFFETQRKAVISYVDEYLLEERAKKEHFTVEQLLDKHVNSKAAPDPSEEALRVFYEGVDSTEPFEAVRGQIVDSIRQRRTVAAKDAFMKSLRDGAKVTYRVAPPRIQVSLKDTPVRGPANARVTLVEFGDYECPYCQQIQPTLDKLEAEFKGKIAFAYKDMPLPMHPNARKAGEATHCAEAQGKYWEFHDLLGQTKQLTMPALKQAARTLKLNTESFDKCLDFGEKAGIMAAHAREARLLGVEGTPTFVINGRFIKDTPDYEGLRAMIEQELEETAPVESTNR
jgi:protein-disulfide isomerase